MSATTQQKVSLKTFEMLLFTAKGKIKQKSSMGESGLGNCF
jgi:hypothetical protein